MKTIKPILPYVLAVVIIVAGYFSVEGIKALIPSHKETVKVFEKPDQDNLFYFGRNSELLIYPWDVLDEIKCISLRNYVSDNEYETVKKTLVELIYVFGDEYGPDEAIFNPYILYDFRLGVCFVKDYVYKTNAGKSCTLNYASQLERDTFFLHCVTEEEMTGNLSLSELQSARSSIDDYIQKYKNNTGESEEELHAYNPFRSFIFRSDIIYYAGSSVLISFTSVVNKDYPTETPYVMPYKEELLLVYYYNEIQVVLFYNPRSDSITGFSIKH